MDCDLPSENFLPPLPEGSVRVRSIEEDAFTSDDFNTVLNFWAKKVKSIDDSDRLLTSGNAILRYNQYNLAETRSWDVDTAEQKEKITKKMHPEYINTVSEHLYNFDDETNEYLIVENGKEIRQDFTQHIHLMSEICKKLNKVYFVGEFGYDRFTVFETNERIMIMRKMSFAALEEDVPLMLIWNFSLGILKTEVTFYPEDDLTPLVFELIREINNEFEIKNAAAI